MKSVFSTLFLLLCVAVYSQDYSLVNGMIIKNIDKFTIDEYEILEQTKGDLNFDSIDDYGIVFTKKLNQTEFITHSKRIVLLFLSIENNEYIIAQNNNLVYYYGFDENFPESLIGLKIDKGEFLIEQYGGFATRWARSTIFSYDKTTQSIVFESDEIQYLDASDFNSVISEKIIDIKNTGIISFAEFNIYSELFTK